ncbi:MAG: hypothetical protein CL916_09795, partial [Deltaproteobacteria bacterium]|nr:hypothetical protein [Deltaproteobacteria bacterium]
MSLFFLLWACTQSKSILDTAEVTDTGEQDSGVTSEPESTDTGDTDVSDTGIPSPSSEPSNEEPPENVRMDIRPNALLVTTLEEEGELHVDCPFFVDEEQIFDASIGIGTVPVDGVSSPSTGVYQFANSGNYTITCTGQYENSTIEASVDIVVLNSTQPPEAAQMSLGLMQAQNALDSILASDGGSDEDLVLAFSEFTASRELFPSEPFGPFRTLPEAFWPDTQRLLDDGIVRNTDDDLLPNQVVLLADRIQALRTYNEQLDPLNITEDDISNIETLTSLFSVQVDAFVALEPSIHGWRENATIMEEQIFTPLQVLTMHTLDLNEIWVRDEAGELIPPPFGFVSLMVGISARHSIQMNIASVLYKDVFESIDATINNLILMEAIEMSLPPQGDISMDYIQASASHGIALPGYDTSIYGSGFSDNAGLNTFLIVGVDWQGAVDGIMSDC